MKKAGTIIIPILIALFVIEGLGIMALVRHISKAQDKEIQIRKTGVQARAKILGITDRTPSRASAAYFIFLLEVHPAVGDVFQVTVDSRVPFLMLSSVPKVGGTIPVRYDPSNIKNVVIDWRALYAAGSNAVH